MTTPVTKKVIIKGRACYSVSDAAKMLGISVKAVENLIAEGKLEAVQLRFNSRRFFVSGESIVRQKYPTSL